MGTEIGDKTKYNTTKTKLEFISSLNRRQYRLSTSGWQQDICLLLQTALIMRLHQNSSNLSMDGQARSRYFAFSQQVLLMNLTQIK